MFSQKEREFLRVLAESPGEPNSERLARQFPNPVYRRRLLWGIRRKAVEAAEDWELYALAAAQDHRVVSPRPLGPAEPVPTHAEPFAALVATLIEAVRRRPKARGDVVERGRP
jgi:hypothetical protein